MQFRVPLNIVEGRLLLTCVIENKSLRVSHKLINFVVDTGSPDSYLSLKDVLFHQIPLENRPADGQVQFGGSTYAKICLPKFSLIVLKDGLGPATHNLNLELCALKTTKIAAKKIEAAQALPQFWV